jgi:hypothetical protein
MFAVQTLILIITEIKLIHYNANSITNLTFTIILIFTINHIHIPLEILHSVWTIDQRVREILLKIVLC